MAVPTNKPSFSTALHAETSGLIPLLVIIDLVEVLRYLAIVQLNPFPFLVIALVYASFTSFGIVSLLLSLSYLVLNFQLGTITEPDFVGYLLSLPFIGLLINLMKFSLHTQFNPKLELNIEKIKDEAEMEETKREFISLAAHQLRTPLGAMRWNLEALLANKHTALDSITKQAVTEVYSSALRMITLVNDLLDINKLLRGQTKEEKMTINLNETIINLIKDTEYLTHKDGIKLSYTEEDLPPVRLDPKSLHEVLLNVITNAIKYSKKNGEVSVSAAVKEKEVIIAVRDQGIGISESDGAKIFTKFYRGENASTAVSDGSGLGLYLVKLLVTNWGGRVWYESKLNEGTTFLISIPH